MMHGVLTSSGLSLLLSCGLATASPQSPVDCAKRIEAAAKTHPRLFFDLDGAGVLRRAIAADPLMAAALEHVEACAKTIETSRPVRREKVGKRLLGVSRTCLKRVVYLAFTYRMTGDRRYLKRAQTEMLAAAAFPDWNPSHFLDVAEMTAALAIGYDWLYPDLDPAARTDIRQAIVVKGLRTSLRGGWWVSTTNNWNQVCHGGLCLGALAVLEDEPKLAAQIVARAVENLPRAMREYRPHGAYPEGPGYWKYGTIYNVLLLDALQTILGTDFGLTQVKGFLQSPDYYLHVTGPTGLFFNYSDGGSKSGIAPTMYWFAAKRNNPSLVWRERSALATFLHSARPAASGADRLMPFLLIWSRPFAKVAPPSALHWKSDGRTPVAMHRSAWRDTATFVAVKGGSPGSNHAHMDIGTFVMDADGVRWALDLGAQSYHSLESKGIRLSNRKQDSQRWTVFRLNTLAHNTLVVDGEMQRVAGSAPITKFIDQAPMPHTIVDLSSAYAGQLASARRGVGLRDRCVLIQDEIKALDRKTVVRWGMVTRAKVKSMRGGIAELARDGKRLTLRVLAPDGVKLQIYETAQPPAVHDHANPGTRMIGFELTVPASAARRLTVLLTPGSVEGHSTKVSPLADW